MIDRLNAALEGRYLIERELGEGGMATVYLADDLKHERKVAVKVLKPELAAVVGAERFLTEIKTTANLQHPHILPLHDSGEADSFLFFVMPYIEGETLRDRLDREKQLPVDEAIRIAADVGEALQSAHEQGVIHRDIKPANILLSKGRPLVADFGIALAVSAAGGGRLTETGLSLGTPYYMSPEQAAADRDPSPASDVYSLGSVLYEMLVGDPPHTGKTAQAVLAKILTERPRMITEVRETVPANVAAAVARALERLPADRFETAQAFVVALGDGSFTHELAATTTTQAITATPGPPSPARAPLARWLPWGVAAAALAVALWMVRPTPTMPPAPTFRMALSDFVVEDQGGGWRMAISRDGATLVASGPGNMLHVRRSDDTDFRPIPGTEEGRNPSISPDGEWVAFTQRGGVNKVQVTGGPVLPVVADGGNPHWFAQNEIVYTTQDGAHRVSSAGGTSTRVVEAPIGRPFMLPGGRAVLGGGPDGLYLHDLRSGERRLIGPGGSNGRYLPTGHILYGDRTVQSVLAVPFDLDALEVTGQPVPVLPSVTIFGGGAVQLAVSDNGTLVHGITTAGDRGRGERLTWIDMDGIRTDLPLEVESGQVEAPRISPDGTRLAYVDDDVGEIFVYNFNTGARTQVTEGLDGTMAVWSPDGSNLYISQRQGGWFHIAADGSTEPKQIAAEVLGPLIDVSPEEDWVVGEFWQENGDSDLYVARLGAEPLVPRPYLRADWHEEVGVVSPDGNWLLYGSNEGGVHEVYIRSFPEPGPAIRVSSEGGGDPVWAPDGSAVFFTGPDNMMQRSARLGGTVELGEERTLFSMAGIRNSAYVRMHDIHPDGDRFLFVTFAEVEETVDEAVQGIGPVVVVVNWFEELRQRMGG